MAFDIPTLVLMIVLVSILMGLSMLTVAWGAHHEGLQLWAAGLGINALAYAFFGFHGSANNGTLLILGNSFTSLALCFLLAAVLRFQGRALRWWLLLLPYLLMVLTMLGLRDHVDLDMFAASLVVAAQSAAILRALSRRSASPPSRGALLVMAGIVALFLVMLLRALSALTGAWASNAFLDSGEVQSLTFITTFSVMMLTSLGFVFMTKERADETNRRLAALDELTGIANRRFIISALDRDVARAIRTREPMAVMMIDIDNFKRVNDTYGHLAGDEVLRCVASVIQHRIRAQDIVGRYGGEEFLVVLADTSSPGAQQLAEQLRAAVEGAPCAHAGKQLSVTVSIGVFGGRLEPGDSWDQIIHAADMALYSAKQAGRNCVEMAQALRGVTRRGVTDPPPDTFPSSLH